MQAETELARIQRRTREVTRELEALEAMKRPSRRDLLRAAQLNEELAWLIVEEAALGADGDVAAETETSPKVVTIR
jgi:hypothetical protein